MPVIDIKTLPTPDAVDRGAVMRQVITALSDAISTPAERIFAGWTFYESQADGLEVTTEFQRSTHPPIVAVDMFQGRTKEQKVNALRAIADVLKKELDFAGHPFVHIRDIPNAQVTTGGNVIDR